MDHSPHDHRVRRQGGLAYLDWLPAGLALLLLIGVGFERRDATTNEEAAVVHHSVRLVAERELPYSVGDWIGTRDDPPLSAQKLLHPNALISRAYRNTRTGETANFLFVHCADSRDLLGHYPPVCYVTHGHELESREPVDWDVGGARITGMRYRFSKTVSLSSSDFVVDDFMLLPTGEFGRDMDSVEAVSTDRDLRLLGAAQVQVVTAATMSDARRDEVFADLVQGVIPILESLRAEARRE